MKIFHKTSKTQKFPWSYQAPCYLMVYSGASFYLGFSLLLNASHPQGAWRNWELIVGWILVALCLGLGLAGAILIRKKRKEPQVFAAPQKEGYGIIVAGYIASLAIFLGSVASISLTFYHEGDGTATSYIWLAFSFFLALIAGAGLEATLRERSLHHHAA